MAEEKKPPASLDSENTAAQTNAFDDTRRSEHQAKTMRRLKQQQAALTDKLGRKKKPSATQAEEDDGVTVKAHAAKKYLAMLQYAAKQTPHAPPEAIKDERKIVRLRWVVGVQANIILVLAFMFVYGMANRGDQNIYAAQFGKDGQQVKQLLARETPLHTDQAVLSWATNAATDILTFGFHNFAARQAANRGYFTMRGWEAYQKAITDSRLQANITQFEQVLTAAPIGPPVIVNIRDLPAVEVPEGGREWTVQVPFMITVLSGKQSTAREIVLTLIIVRVPATESLTGLAFDNWVES